MWMSGMRPCRRQVIRWSGLVDAPGHLPSTIGFGIWLSTVSSSQHATALELAPNRPAVRG
jgi:hypothetical protein